MKKFLFIALASLLAAVFALTSFADGGLVTYKGGAEGFIYEPGSSYSPTDLFPDFKDVMPGDTVTQTVKVKNLRSKEVKVDIYLRALGAEEGSEEFLSQLHLTVKEKKDTIMFNAAANETDGLTDWVKLGTLYSGGEAELIVTLEVPVTLGNEFKNQAGYLDWEFRVDEFPVDPDDPKPPQTGEHTVLWITVALLSLVLLIILFIVFRRRRKDEDEKGVMR